MCAVAIVWSANHSCRSWDRSQNETPTTPPPAAKLLSELAGKEFQSARQLAAYAGLTPAERRSGYSLYGKTRLSKIGNAFLRKALYLPAAAARRWCKPLKPWIVILESRKLHHLSIPGALMRKLLPIPFRFLKHQKPFNPLLVSFPKTV